MHTLVSCPHGHQWQVRKEQVGLSPQLVCPVCGSSVEGLVDESLGNPGAVTSIYPPLAKTATSPGPPPPPPQKQIGAYQIQGVLGRGGMGIVYKAFHPALKRIVALKMILDSGDDAMALARFNTEAEAV